ncbi:hypothetical protein M513_02059 [Trichuris suis]|uniref:Uncharacterized protein n=1 Tax=Trichuris suis TaxID=68888 RepID=A0A085MIX8_9BILA|nr:hypothetical protein M513_02059 [Trichuris suis]
MFKVSENQPSKQPYDCRHNLVPPTGNPIVEDETENPERALKSRTEAHHEDTQSVILHIIFWVPCCLNMKHVGRLQKP